MDTKALPTHIADVEPWLRSLANPAVLAGAVETGNVNAYLLGMAIVKLSDAHAKIARLKVQLEHATEKLEMEENGRVERGERD